MSRTLTNQTEEESSITLLVIHFRNYNILRHRYRCTILMHALVHTIRINIYL